jgi:uncharacterized protein
VQHPHINHAIDYIELTAPDLKAMKRFYGEVFGWSFQDWGDEYASFSDGRVEGGLRQGKPAAGSGAPLIILYASNLEETEARVRSAGAQITTEIFSFPGGRRFHFADPAGNELAVWSDK